MQSLVLPPVAPEWVVGLWGRESITLADGTVDRDTQVYWGQTRTLYVDLRIPADRARMSRARTFSALSAEDVRRLAQQRGFAGHISIIGDQCTWFRDIDYQPDTGRPDTGRLRLDGDVLFESGAPESVVGAGYEEVYRRVSRGDRLRAALRQVDAGSSLRADSSSPGMIVVLLDDRFLCARARVQKLPAAASLQSLINAAGQDLQRIRSFLDCEVCLGTVGRGDGLQIELSTIPFREGEPLFPPVGADVDESGSHLTLRGPDWVSRWQILETTVAPRDLAVLFSTR